MLGIPSWGWAILALAAVVAVRAGLFYSRFRRMCRLVREELTERLQREHPEIRVEGERLGNLVVRMPDGTERLWEMTDVYGAVAHLPGMGSDPADRAKVYDGAIEMLVRAAPTPTDPVTRATHEPYLKPQLVPVAALGEQSAGEALPYHELPDLGLAIIYVLDLPLRRRPITEADRDSLGMELRDLHLAALDNLRGSLPREMVAGVLEEGSGAASQAGDTFDAARLLLVPELLQPGEELLALIPHRDMLLLLPASLREEPEKLEEGLRALQGEHSPECSHPPLLDRPVRVTAEGFEIC